MASYYISGGVIESGAQLNGDYMYVYSGGSAVDVNITNGDINIYAGGSADQITVFNGAVYVSGGNLTNADISKGNLEVSSNGSASTVSIASGAAHIMAGASASDMTVNNKGMLYVSGGAAVDGADITSGGHITVYESGTLENAELQANGKLYISSGATVNNLIWTPCDGSLVIEQGANVTFGSDGTQTFSGVYWGENGVNSYHHSGGSLVTSLDIVTRMKETIANKMNANMETAVSGALAENNMNYEFTVREVSPNEIDVGAAAYDYAGVTGSMYVMSGGCAVALPVTGGDMHVWGGGSGAYIIVSGAEARLFVSGGATVYGAAAMGAGSIEVQSDAQVLNKNRFLRKYESKYTDSEGNEQTGYDFGDLFGDYAVPQNPVELQGAGSIIGGLVDAKYKSMYSSYMTSAQQTLMTSANNRFENYGIYGVAAQGVTAKVNVAHGGYVEDALVANAGSMTVAGSASGMIVSNGGYLEVKGLDSNRKGVVSDFAAQGAGDFVRYRVEFQNNQKIQVYNGGVAAAVVVVRNNGVVSGNSNYANGANINVLSGGSASDIRITGAIDVLEGQYSVYKSDSGGAQVLDNIIWLNSSYYSAGNMTVHKGASVDNIHVGGIAANTILEDYGDNGILTLSGTATDTVIDGGGMLTVANGGVASGVTIEDCAFVKYERVSPNGGIETVTTNRGGSAVVQSGGVMMNLTANTTRGSVTVSSGGMVGGRIFLQNRGQLSFNAGGVLEFTVSERTPGDDFLVNGYKLIEGSPNLTITVSDYQANGTYRLAQGAENFAINKVFTVGNGSDVFGRVSANSDALGYDKKFYSVEFDGHDVYLTVSSGDLFDAVLTSPVVTADNSAWTNQVVTLTAEFTPVAVRNEYKIGEDGEWQLYTSGVVANANETYYFRSTDSLGRQSEEVEHVVSNIDTSNPVYELVGESERYFEYVDISVRNLTDYQLDAEGNAILDANGNPVAGAGISSTSFSFDQYDWKGGSTVRVTENGTVYFRVVDNAGNTTIHEYTVNTIGDNLAPRILVSGNPVDWTNQSVAISITIEDIDKANRGDEPSTVSGILSVEYSTDGVTYTAIADEDITFNADRSRAEYTFNFDANTNLYLRITDAAHNVLDKTIVINKIDKDAPELELAPSTIDWTNQSVVITAAALDTGCGLQTIQYKNADGEWVAGETYEVFKNGEYEFRAIDNLGNTSEVKVITVSCIDTVRPTVTVELTPDFDGWVREDVVLTITASDDNSGIYLVEFSEDGVNWSTFTGSTINVVDNKTYYFKATDKAGNISTVNKIDVKIDRIAPELIIDGNTNVWTNKPVTLSAFATDTLSGIDKYYYLNADSEWVEGSTLEVTANGTYSFKVLDNAGNETVKDVVVDRIDTVIPELEVTGNATDWTNKDVVLAVSASDDSSGIASVEYSADGSNWKKVVNGTVTVSKVQTVQFRASDVAGNVSKVVSVDVDLIDKEAPVITVTGNAADWTNKSVNLTVEAVDAACGLDKLEYSFDNTKWNVIKSGDMVKVDNNTTVYVKATDKLGQVATQEISVSKIDKTAPELAVTGNAVEWTAGNVTLFIAASDLMSGIAKVEYTLDNITWKSVDDSVVISKNSTVAFRAYDNAGNVSKTVDVVVDKIDKTAPVLSVSASITEPTRRNVVVTATAVDAEDGCGVAGIEYSFDKKVWTTGSSVSVSENTKVYFRAVDKVGNAVTQSITVDNILDDKSDYNLLSNGTSQIVGWDAKKGTVGFVAVDGEVSPEWRGIWEWNRADALMWKVVGVGHFAGSKVDQDGILLYNGFGNTFAAWTNLNDPSYGYVSLCHVDGSFNTKCLTNMDNDKYDDVLICDKNGSFGVVLDGATYKDIWHSEDAASNPWELVGAGNFGAKTEQLIVKSSSGHLYLWTNKDTSFKTWNWGTEAIGYLGNDWEFITAGDFKGDGIDDIVVRKFADGGLWVWDDGDVDTAHWVGTPGEGFKVEAAGDYNGDGKDDLLLREYTTGWGGCGYWASADANLWNDLNARVETGFDSKFSIIA